MRKILLPLIAASLLTFSCKKVAGPQGPAGATGNANVKVYTFTGQSFTQVTASYYKCDVVCSDLSSNDLDKSAIVAYFKTSGTLGSWTELPYSYGGTNFNVTYSIGQFQVFVNTNLTGTYDFKLVIIPPAMRHNRGYIDLPAQNTPKRL